MKILAPRGKMTGMNGWYVQNVVYLEFLHNYIFDNVKTRPIGRVKKEKGDNNEHNLPAMQSMGFETGSSSSVTENREATTSRESVPSIPVPTPSETSSLTTQIWRSERCHPPLSQTRLRWVSPDNQSPQLNSTRLG